MSQQPKTDYDVVIAGGGLAGLSLACALETSGHWRIALVEAQPESARHPASFDERVLALSAMTVRLLKALNLWQELDAEGASIGQIHISDQGSYGKTRLYAQEHGFTEFGRVMPARLLGEVLQKRAAELKLDWFRPSQILATEVDETARVVHLSSGESLRTQLLVVAEGAESSTCQLLQLQARAHHYEHVAIIANVQTNQPHHNWAYERFTPNGPLALLPMTEERRSLVWTRSPEQAQQLMSLSDEAFMQELQQALGYQSGHLIKVGERYAYPLKLHLVEESIRARAVALGNSAHALHPIAGQGFNLGLRDVMELALQLIQARKDKKEQAKSFDAGDYALLANYQEMRAKDQHGVAQATHTLAVLSSNDASLLQLGRSAGLCALAHLKPARTVVIEKAMGLAALSCPPEELFDE